MATIRVATDEIDGPAADKKRAERVCELLRQAGHTVTYEGRGPNKIQAVMQSSSKQCDIMIQVAGGRCIGTLCDFYLNIKSGYYKAKVGAFLYYKKSMDWRVYRSGDDGFSHHGAIKREVDKWLGKKLTAVYDAYKGTMYWGQGDNAEDLVKTFLNNYTGSSGSSSGTTGGGSNALELIKQAITSYDDMGMETLLKGDTLTVRKTNMNNNTPLSKQTIVNNSISYEEYDPNTPNQVSTGSGVVKDERLIEMYGAVPYTLEQNQVVQATKRGHGHSIDLKTLLNTDLVVGSWVKLYLDELDLNGELYYVTKNTFDEEHVIGVTLEPFPPSRKVEITEETTEETTEEETTEEEA